MEKISIYQKTGLIFLGVFYIEISTKFQKKKNNPTP